MIVKTVLVIDSCPLGRMGMTTLLQECFGSDYLLVKAYPALSLDLKVQPDMIILHLRGWVFQALDDIPKIQAKWPEAALILGDADPFSGTYIREKVISQCLQFGLRGYFSQQTPLEKIKEVLQTVVQGGLLLQSFHFHSQSNHRNQELVKAFLSLSEREQEVLQLLTQNLSNPEIAKQLCISLRTVESHKNSIRQKFGAKTIFSLIQPELAYLLHTKST